MTNDESTDDDGSTGLMTRRKVMAAAAAVAGSAALGSAATSDTTNASVGGGPMADQQAEHLIKQYKGTFAERPDPGVAGRIWEVDDPSDDQHHGAIYIDDGSSWELADRQYKSIKTDQLSGIAKQPDNLADIRTHLSAGGNVVDPQQGTYQVPQGSPIQAASNTTVIIREGVRFESADANNPAQIFENANPSGGDTNVRFIGLGGVIDCKATGEVNGNGIYLENVTDSLVKDVIIQNAGFMGVRCLGGQNNTVKGCEIRDSGHHNVEIKRCDESLVADCTLTGSDNYDNVQIDEASECKIRDNTCKNPSRNNITVMTRDATTYPTSGNVVTGNTCSNGTIDMGTADADSKQFEDITITNNSLNNSPIRNRKAVDATITGNTIAGGIWGIRVGSFVSRASITNNVIHGQSGSGANAILVQGGENDVGNNILWNVDGDILRVQGVDNHVSDNVVINDSAGWAITEDGQGDANRIVDNDLLGGNQNINRNGADTILRDNHPSEVNAYSTAPNHALGREVLAGPAWDPDGDGNAEKVMSDGSTWQEVADLPNWT